jgi:tRNA dimethylallyltransferase
MADHPRTPHVALVGPTAAGKSAIAMRVARERGGVELVTVDSMQVYRGMDIGTAKPTVHEQAEVPHHLLDLVDPADEFTVAEWQRAARVAIGGIDGRGNAALLVGGTGLYLRSVTDDLDIPGRFPEVRAAVEEELAGAGPEALHGRLAALDPLAASRMEPSNTRRVVRALEVTLGSGRPFSDFGPGLEAHPPSPIAQVGVAVEPAELAERIAARYEQQLAAGFLEEVAALADRHLHPLGLSRTAAQALGYKELLAHLDGACSLDEAVDLAVRRTRQFARRQRAWFRRDPRIRWCAPDEAADVLFELLDGPIRPAPAAD